MLIDNFPRMHPISNLQPMFKQETDAEAKRVPGAVFTDALERAVKNINELSAISNAERAKVLLGETDDLHSSLIASQKAGLAQDMFMQSRNRIMEAYSELLRIQV